MFCYIVLSLIIYTKAHIFIGAFVETNYRLIKKNPYRYCKHVLHTIEY